MRSSDISPLSKFKFPEKRGVGRPFGSKDKKSRTSNYSNLGAIRNPDGIFINTKLFSEAAQHHKKYGYYCGDPVGTPAWRQYWDEELRRCSEGYSIGGVKITGHHYGYLNYAPIMKVDAPEQYVPGLTTRQNLARSKELDFPDFWDGDYNYFHILEIARKGCTPEEFQDLMLSVKIREEHLFGGKDMLVGKARRKGYSYKNAWVCANTYNTIRNSLCLVGAFDKAYLYTKGKGIMSMANFYLDYLNSDTAWTKGRDYRNTVDNKKASFRKEVNGIVTESGYKSEIVAISFKDNPDAARGKDPYIAMLDETGAWPGFKLAWGAIVPSTTAGIYKTGMMVGFGTSGDMESGTADFAEMFFNPDLWNLLPFVNIWDEDSEESECAFFHPMQWNMEGFYDENGNSNQLACLEYEEAQRKKIISKSSAGSLVMQSRMQEFPTGPSEAFQTVSTNNFPVVQLKRRLEKVRREKLDRILWQPVHLLREEGKVVAKPDMDSILNPIWNRKPETKDLKGAVLIKEFPLPNAPKGLYKIGFDPIAQDDGTSLSSIVVIKGTYGISATNRSIVARWIGRTEESDDTNLIFELLCELYRSQGMFENMVLHVKTYFRLRSKLHLLAAQPDQVISKAIKDSGVERNYGCHMNKELKEYGETVIKNWLYEVKGYTEDGSQLTTIDYIDDIGMLEELIAYHPKGNFDRVMSLMMALFQMLEEKLGKDYAEEEEKVSELADLANKLYQRPMYAA